MKNNKGFPWWLIFIFTCFLSWLSVLTAWLIVKNKAWIIAGCIYSISFFFTFTIPFKEKEIQIIHSIENKFTYSLEDSVKYIDTIKIHENSNPQNYISDLGKIKDLENKYKVEMQNNLKKANPETELTYKNIVLSVWMLFTFTAFIHAIVIIKKYRTLLAEKESDIEIDNPK